MAVNDQTRQQQRQDLERLQLDQERQQQQQEILEQQRSNDVAQLDHDLGVDTWLLQRVFDTVGGMITAGQWTGERMAEGLNDLSRTVETYLKDNPVPSPQVLERVASSLDTLEKELRTRDLPGADLVGKLLEQVNAAKVRHTQPQLDPNAPNTPTSVPQPTALDHTGHTQPQEGFEPNRFNQPGNVPVPAVLSNTGGPREQPEVTNVFNTVDDGSTRANAAEILAKNMQAENLKRVRRNEPLEPGWIPKEGYAAHHIAPYQGTWKDGRAQLSKDIQAEMDRLGIGLNEAVNGVFLPHNRDVRIDSQNGGPSYHPRVHKIDILQDLYDGLKAAKNRQEGIQVLDQMRERLLKNYYDLSLEQPQEVEAAYQSPSSQPLRTFSQEEITAYIAKVNPVNLTLVERAQKLKADWEAWQAEVVAGPAYTNRITGEQTYKLDRMPQVALNNPDTDLGRAARALTVAEDLFTNPANRQEDGSYAYEGRQFTYQKSAGVVVIAHTVDQSPVLQFDTRSKALTISQPISDEDAALIARNHAMILARDQHTPQDRTSGWER